jgi:hypothetical protein
MNNFANIATNTNHEIQLENIKGCFLSQDIIAVLQGSQPRKQVHTPKQELTMVIPKH